MRLFVALVIPDPIRDEMDAAVADLRERHGTLRWTAPEQWHITLAFLGDVEQPPTEVAGIVADGVTGAPAEIRLALGQPGRFGRRVLWIGVDDDPAGAVAALGASIQDRLERSDLPVDPKPVHPHVTLARAGRDRAPIVASIVDDLPDVSGAWTVDEAVLYSSEPAGHGVPNRYVARARVSLGGGT